ncbi:endonuclease-reverse transcriptase [Plakobranchus ocellatus]|uniref:Endonuclease-reverse transcriptase n=1 Tax=Plakobranchus ocellatus TaxID=259542 RepID=A0AAV4A4C6_9GAST|nr:endonuclease-reverse transcriptase [Plakobranchus ocellatus]
MIKENGESTTLRDEIITICQTFYMKFYEQTIPDQPTTLTSSPDKEEIPPFLAEEVKETLDEMKKKKAPGNDGITDKNGGGQNTLLEKKTIDELKDAQIGNQWFGRSNRGRPEARLIDDIRNSAGPQWQRKAQDRRKWKTYAEGYILQWMYKASK